MGIFNNVIIPDIPFNGTVDMLQAPQSYTFPQAVPLHQKKIETKEEPDVIISDKPDPVPDPYPEGETILQKLMDWLSNPLNLSLFVSIIALLLVILF